MTLSPMVLPRIEGDAASRNYGRFIIGPLESGYGTTLGNALRRVLLSSLPGAAITSLRVSDVPHEFSAIPNVREDMTQLLLNVKQLRLTLVGAEMARLRLEVQGEGTVTAGDIVCPPEVTVINPDLYLFTADNANAKLEIEFNVQTGRGFTAADDRTHLPIGEVPIDSIFSPIRRVNFDVDRARVGQRTNYDKLVLEIWTDGTIRADQAMSEAARLLIDQLAIVANVRETGIEPIGTQRLKSDSDQRSFNDEKFNVPIESLDLSVRVFNSLKRTGIMTVSEVLDMLERGTETMLSIRNFGEKSLTELVERLEEKGYPIPAAIRNPPPAA